MTGGGARWILHKDGRMKIIDNSEVNLLTPRSTFGQLTRMERVREIFLTLFAILTDVLHSGQVA